MNSYAGDMDEIQKRTEELLTLLVKDGVAYEEQYLKQAVEQLARVVYDLTVVVLNEHIDRETTLQATKTKMKITCNLLENG
ncbi:hypothetical protein [Thermaerobacillus caldiproteolyticus]|uniref:F0F1-type ATP synthase membrane subunit b/b n=1 Tax=Thermaerobacillus caldiproteolyticus TaxID=247480 RepID=A0A7V9Z551_9BACL|nr:hypothetical protein [Anoxybacillus caldiproteolyticus]MBA2874219.1 F0F1-type ATP synthase membrane subunit b/b' [Anoxybacillus caldiproteolyticus]QPA31847.1 hypothetical protein ISX45_02240 [Anoxybacillus caldiproteolyticus]